MVHLECSRSSTFRASFLFLSLSIDPLPSLLLWHLFRHSGCGRLRRKLGRKLLMRRWRSLRVRVRLLHLISLFPTTLVSQLRRGKWALRRPRVASSRKMSRTIACRAHAVRRNRIAAAVAAFYIVVSGIPGIVPWIVPTCHPRLLMMHRRLLGGRRRRTAESRMDRRSTRRRLAFPVPRRVNPSW